jgi:hypothetical protein
MTCIRTASDGPSEAGDRNLLVWLGCIHSASCTLIDVEVGHPSPTFGGGGCAEAAVKPIARLSAMRARRAEC